MTTGISGPALRVEGLSLVTPDGVVLLKDTSFEIGRDEVVLIVGPSASGKSTVVNLLCGLLDLGPTAWRATGTLTAAGRTMDLSSERCEIGSVVFQQHALFDELTVVENLRIAADHAAERDADLSGLATALLADVATDKEVAACSGGTQQRVAIARTLLANRPVMFLDEPNSGLDVASSRLLASTIRGLCKRTGRPAVIVAHHVNDLVGIVDRVLLFDNRACVLRPVPGDAATIERELLALKSEIDTGTAIPSLDGADATPRPDGGQWAGGLRPASRLHWFMRYFRAYFWVFCGSPLLLAYVGVAGLIIGFVTVWFGFNFRSIGRYLVALLHDETLAGIGLLQITVAVPLITSILLAARNNAVITADIATRSYSAQLLAMRNLHIPSRLYILVPIVLNMVIGFVLLCSAAAITASWASLQTWHFLFPGEPFQIWQNNFFRLLLHGRRPLGEELGWALLKVVVSALGASALGIGIGLIRRGSALTINHAVAESIIAGVTFTLLVHAAITLLQV